MKPWWNPRGTLPQGRPGPPRRPQSFQLTPPRFSRLGLSPKVPALRKNSSTTPQSASSSSGASGSTSAAQVRATEPKEHSRLRAVCRPWADLTKTRSELDIRRPRDQTSVFQEVIRQKLVWKQSPTESVSGKRAHRALRRKCLCLNTLFLFDHRPCLLTDSFQGAPHWVRPICFLRFTWGSNLLFQTGSLKFEGHILFGNVLWLGAFSQDILRNRFPRCKPIMQT